jgi:hypothetical protein
MTDLSRIRSLRGLLPLLELFQHVDGCFYSHFNFTIPERILVLDGSPDQMAKALQSL